MEKLRKALDENRVAAEEAGSKLAAKEKQIQDMVDKHRKLIVRLVCGGPTAFMEWAREELRLLGLSSDLDDEFARAWRIATTVPDQVEDKMLISDQFSDNSPANASRHESSAIRSGQTSTAGYEESAKPELPISWTNLSVKLLGLMFGEVFRQMEESYDRVKSPFSLPSVVAGFWLGLARRFTYLAVASLLPQLVSMERSAASPPGVESPLQEQPSIFPVTTSSFSISEELPVSQLSSTSFAKSANLREQRV